MNPRLEQIYRQIPKSTCIKNCGKCCGILFPSLAEIRNVKEWCEHKHIEYKDFHMIEGDSCPYLLEDKTCQIYPARPFLCRIMGVAAATPCPINGVTPDKVLPHSQYRAMYREIYLKGKEASRTKKHWEITREIFQRAGLIR